MLYPHELVLKPSRLSFLAIAALHSGVAIVFLFQAMALHWLAGALLILSASAWFAWRRESARRNMCLWLANDGRLLVDTGGGLAEVTLLSGVDFGQVVWLSWVDPSRASGWCRFMSGRSVMLLPDHVATGNWRRFRIWLRHKALIGANERADADVGA